MSVTPGRIVRYRNGVGKISPAIVSSVGNDVPSVVCLFVFDDTDPMPRARHDVPYSEHNDPHSWHWPERK